MDVYREITSFLYLEANLLDDHRLDEWLEVLHPGIVYRMPLRVTRERGSGSDIVEDMTFFEENKQSLVTRVERLKTTSAWAENPPSRTRHFVTNVLVEEGQDGEWHVSSYFQMLRSRGSKPEVEQIFGKRQDVLCQVGGKWQVKRRTIYPDQTVLGIRNISNFL